MSDCKVTTEKLHKTPKYVQDLIPICRISEDGIFELEKNPDGAKKQYDRAYLFEDANFATMDDPEKEDFLKLYCGIHYPACAADWGIRFTSLRDKFHFGCDCGKDYRSLWNRTRF
ncbi:MAG: hypothetical protein LUG99_04600 [Lachnospiraceae bacterium]|nr:hypothetical protein [Lachnospiraceae bacterium]